MGSVKNLRVALKATPKAFGRGIFEFTNDYSVFDYGKMPNKIPDKGKALCRMAAYNFEELEKQGIQTHFEKLVSGNQMQVKLVQVLYPQKNELGTESTNYLVPLEIIFRNSLPNESSVFKRLDKGKTTPQALGLNRMPMAGEKLEKPILDVSTKLEDYDRYLGWKEAQQLAFLSDSEVETIQAQALQINDFISRKANEIGLEHADGKTEFGLGPTREILLVDVCGTLDENRLLFNKVHLSKQVLRDYYATTRWATKMDEAKNTGLPKENWPAPESIPLELKKIVSNMYKSVCEAWIEKRIWNAPSIDNVVQAYQNFLDKQRKG